MGCCEAPSRRNTFRACFGSPETKLARSVAGMGNHGHVPLVISLAISSAFSLGYLSANTSPTRVALHIAFSRLDREDQVLSSTSAMVSDAPAFSKRSTRPDGRRVAGSTGPIPRTLTDDLIRRARAGCRPTGICGTTQ